MDDARAADQGDILEFRLPDLGEGLTDAELQSWSVAVGDRVELNQTVAEVETAKAVVVLPSPFTGTVIELLAEPGETIPVGAPLLRVRGDGPPVGGGRSSVLVGYGPEDEPVTRRRRRPETRRVAAYNGNHTGDTGPDPGMRDGERAAAIDSGHTGPGDTGIRVPDTAASAGVGARDEAADDTGPSGVTHDALGQIAQGQRVAATPGARKLARELGIDLWCVAGSGPAGAVTVDDVRAAVPVTQGRGREIARADSGVVDRPPREAPAVREERTPISGIRKRTAAAMSASAHTIPQAATSVTIDITASMELLDHLRTTPAFAQLSPTPLALVAKAVLVALTEFPGVNAFWDEKNQEIVTKHYVNLGIAVATERGLLVPNVKEAQSLTLRELCREIGWLAETARTGRATPSDLRGGTFTISNVGVFGVDSGVPLVNPGEAAILCLGAITRRPWVFRDELAIRQVTTLTLSFDHRMIDGELAARFLSTVAGLLEDPLTLLGRV
ncbi:dihydrolipoamide acetyltransferase family protein [Nocardia brevicatena]|uniref:dihydrolipoamide acetyltransferase family protein n=1 Tax=Nocardia brevicatena TaxID=37327 RepID=UPI00031EA79F|nr:dihydrolipoamide acetyltransferase family protein [Nocardia brevicatena]